MKKLLTSIAVIAGLFLHAQLITSPQQLTDPQTPVTGTPGCLADELRRQRFLQDPMLEQQHNQVEQNIRNFIQSGNAQRSSSSYVIPVVVHIIHNNGPENITNAQVIAGIQYMNDAFANTGAFTDPNGVNTDIQFCLAQQDEFGNASTGINRVVSPLTNMTAETDDAALKSLVIWDPTKYMNIWLVAEITSLSAGSGVAGYAYFPSAHGQPIDGLVAEALYFGSSADNTKVPVHEVGHYLGLYHTFEGGCTNNDCLADGDRVCDTPPDNSSAASGCVTNLPNTCSTDIDDLSVNNPFRPVSAGGLGDQPDLIANYMDYSQQACQTLFTAGQATRMVAALTTTRASLLQSNGCQSLCTSLITIGFNMSATVITAGGNVTFTNTTAGATSYEWYVGSQQIATTTNANYTFLTPGYYTVTLIATNNDSSCDKTMSQVVHVQCGAQASFTVSPAGPYNPGATLTFTNTSTSASGYEWVLDGTSQGITTNYSNTFNTPGGHYIYLVATNGQCSDTAASFFFDIGNCGQSGMIQHWFIPEMSMHFSGTNLPTIGSSPVPIPSVAGTECTSSISDVNGNLQLFTDGVTVWNRNQQPMPNGNGLMGHPSATQSCLVVPDPGSPTRYYIFTTDGWETQFAAGLRYTIVDMTLNNGLGDVVVSSKNILVRTGVGEKVCGTYHDNNQDIWIATNSAVGNTVYAYLITAAGVAATPVISTVGTGTAIGLGGMKFSHDGNRLAVCLVPQNAPRYVRVMDFNKSTGACTNAFDIAFGPNPEQPYDVEFSPNNSKMYVSMLNYGRVYQFDMSAGSPAAIIASSVRVDPFTTSTNSYAHTTLGADGRIYISRNQTHLDYITDPNLPGTACNYTLDALQVPNGGVIGWCLPNLIHGIDLGGKPQIAGPSELCANALQEFTIANAEPGDSAQWTHSGDGIIASFSDTTLMLQAGNGGTDTIFMKCFGSCGVVFDTIVVTTFPPVIMTLGPDLTFCSPTLLVPSGSFTSYTWENGWQGSTHITGSPGTYWVTVIDGNGCTASDTIQMLPWNQQPPVYLGNDISVCIGGTVVLDPGHPYLSYDWQNGSIDSTFTAFQPGIYWVTVSDGCNISTDTIRITNVEAAIPLDLGADTAVCENGFPVMLTAPSGYSYVWQNGSGLNTFPANNPGTFWVTVTDVNGCSAQDTIFIDDCTGTVENFTAEMIQVYPNPAGDKLTISFGAQTGNVQLELFDAAGRHIISTTTSAANYEINTSMLADGVYVLQVRTGDAAAQRKVVIRH